MGILGYLFKIPYMSEHYHKILTEEYNFHPFVAFAVLFTAAILVFCLIVLCFYYDLVHLHPLKLPFVYIVLSLFLYPQWSFLEEIIQKLVGLFAF